MASTVAKSISLYTPILCEVASVIDRGLRNNFENVEVSVIDCPDLSEPPFYLASRGICGSQRVADVGGVPYLAPLALKNKQYRLKEVANQTGLVNGLVVGAGAGPWHIVGVNCELISNMLIGESASNQSRTAKINLQSGLGEMEKLESDEFAILGNFYLSEGKPGKVIEIKVSKRTGEEEFIQCIRKSLAAEYKEKPVALGGVFAMEKGKAKVHIMPDFSPCPLTDQKMIDDWLVYYTYDAPLTSVGYLVSHDPGLHLRMEHFHCFSDRGEGGHFHYDTTPGEVEYRAYFGVADFLYRIDPPL